MNGVGSGGRIFAGFRSVLGWFRVVRIFAGFCQKSPDLDETSADLKEIKPILARYGRILMRSRHISKRSSQISTRSHLTLRFQAGSQQIGQKMGDFPSSSGRISTNRIENVRFFGQIQSGRLKSVSQP